MRRLSGGQHQPPPKQTYVEKSRNIQQHAQTNGPTTVVEKFQTLPMKFLHRAQMQLSMAHHYMDDLLLPHLAIGALELNRRSFINAYSPDPDTETRR
jgi:hypothetical protein